jgi:predicted nucleic acid-binding protein
MATKKAKKDEIKPLDMTTDEAINFLFPKEVVDELKMVANQPKRQAKVSNDKAEIENGDSSYKYNNE